MPQYRVADLPESHRRAREILRRRWREHAPDTAPAWLVTIDGKQSVVAAGPTKLVIVTPGLNGSEYSLPYDTIQDDGGPMQVAFREPAGYVYRFDFGAAVDTRAFRAAVADRTVSRADADERAREERRHPSFLVVTTDTVPGREIVDVHGDVVGVVVRARNVFSNFAAGMRTVVGGESAGYTDLLASTRRQARNRMVDAALERGANAVVGMRYDSTEIADLMSEVTAYGTAVTIRSASA